MTAIKNRKKLLALLLSIILIVTAFIPGTMAFVVDESSPLLNTFIPGVIEKGRIKLTKTIEHPFSANYVIPDALTFDYEIDFGAAYANISFGAKDGDKDVTVTADAAGKATVKVSPLRDFVISGIDEGTQITVTEQQDKEGFKAKDEIYTQTKTVIAAGTVKFGFTNVYTPAAVSASDINLTGEKQLSGRPWQEGDSFTFELSAKDGDSFTKVLEKQITYDENNADFNKFDLSEYFDGVTFDKEGTYYFKVTEKPNTMGASQDMTEYYIAITVGDTDMDGKLEIISVEATPAPGAVVTGNNVHVVFSSNITPPVINDADWSLITLKTMINNNVEKEEDKLTAEGFDFIVEDGSGNEIIIKTGADGKAAFDRTFTKDDIGNSYTYKVYEKQGDIEGVLYDTKQYELSVSVGLDAQNKLEIITDFVLDDELDTIGNSAVTYFENVYDPAAPVIEDIKVDINITKTVKNLGTLKIGAEDFKFELKDKDGSVAAQGKTNTDGEAVLSVSYGAADINKEFEYVLSEVNEQVEGMTYDETVYNIGVIITQGEDGKLIAEVSKNDATVAQINCAFENIYDKDLGEEGGEGEDDKPSGPPTGDKAMLMWMFIAMLAAGVTLLIVTLRKKSFEK